MLNNKEIAEKLEQIKSAVTSYVYENMNDEFKTNMYNQEGSRATLKTAEGSKVKFTSYKGYTEQYVFVETEGQVMDKPFEFNFCSSMSDYGTGTIFSENYGIAFWNVGDDKREPIIKPFRNILGRKVYLFANKAIDEILPLIEQFSKDIKTITPVEETKAYLKKQEDSSAETETQEKSIASELKDLENLKTELLGLYSFPESLDSDELSENNHLEDKHKFSKSKTS